MPRQLLIISTRVNAKRMIGCFFFMCHFLISSQRWFPCCTVFKNFMCQLSMGFRNGWPMSNFMFAWWDIDSWLPLSFACFVCYACFARWGITAWLPLTFACYACFTWWDITAWLPLSFAWLLPVLSMAATIVCHPVVWGEGEGTIHHSTTLLFNYFS